jgi:hypothetical protein
MKNEATTQKEEEGDEWSLHGTALINDLSSPRPLAPPCNFSSSSSSFQPIFGIIRKISDLHK